MTIYSRNSDCKAKRSQKGCKASFEVHVGEGNWERDKEDETLSSQNGREPSMKARKHYSFIVDFSPLQWLNYLIETRRAEDLPLEWLLPAKRGSQDFIVQGLK